MGNKLYSKIYLWLFLGLLVSFLTGYFVSTNVNMLFNLIKPGYVIGILIIEVFIAIFLSARITKMQPMTAKILYFVYSFTTGSLSDDFTFVRASDSQSKTESGYDIFQKAVTKIANTYNIENKLFEKE